ncbi:MAG: hypothetical protein V3U95_06310 [Dehalococcoidia bacterium]|nr:hypothetical protein [Chloroflexota bacterium]MCZ6866665.1 hypothetical protein [Chloroflexota bacterium]
MPRKGRRVAAKQAQLGQKRKRGRGPSGIPVVMPPQNRDGQAATVTRPEAATIAEARPIPTSAPSIAQTRRVETRNRPLVYSFVGAEIRRIMLLSSVIIAILVTLSFVLD